MNDWKQMLDADVLTLGMAADEARRRALGNVVTYLRVYDVGAEGMPAGGGQVPEAAAELRLYTAPATLEEAVASVRAMKAAGAGRRVVAFSLADLIERGWADPSSLRALVDAGLSDVAELPVDQVSDLEAGISMLTAGGLAPQRLTVSRPIAGDRVEFLRRVTQAFDGHPSLRRFSPLPRLAPADKPTTGYDDVRMVALSRLALGSRSIEVDWSLYGPKLAQVALTFGADHLDAVPASDDAALGRRRTTVEDVERNVKAAGFDIG